MHSAQLAEHGGSSTAFAMRALLDFIGHLLNRSTSLPTLTTRTSSGSRPLMPSGSPRNHAFVDGNKRTALVVLTFTFLDRNGWGIFVAEEKEDTILHLPPPRRRPPSARNNSPHGFKKHAVPL